MPRPWMKYAVGGSPHLHYIASVLSASRRVLMHKCTYAFKLRHIYDLRLCVDVYIYIYMCRSLSLSLYIYIFCAGWGRAAMILLYSGCMVMSVGDVVRGVADAAREFFRFFAPTERLVLQGFPRELIYDFPEPTLALKAAGNAYPVPLIVASVAPLIRAIAESPHVDFPKWPGALPSLMPNSRTLGLSRQPSWQSLAAPLKARGELPVSAAARRATASQTSNHQGRLGRGIALDYCVFIMAS